MYPNILISLELVMTHLVFTFILLYVRNCAEEALRLLNGTPIGGQNIRLSWGRSPSNKQVVVLYSSHVRGWFLIIVLPEQLVILFVFSPFSLRRILTNGTVAAIMGMGKDTKTIAMLRHRRTLICSTVAMAAMEITSSHHHSNRSSSSKEDTCRFEVLFTLPWLPPPTYRVSPYVIG